MINVAVLSSPFSSTSSALPAVHPSGDARHAWRWTVDEMRHARLGHAAEWSTVIERAYGHEPLYLTADDGEGHRGVLPAFIVRRPLFGSVVTSMPFLDSGGPCSSSPVLARLLVEHLIAESRRVGATFVDLRCAEPLPIDARADDRKVNMTLALPDRADVLWNRFDKSVRNQIRKAERAGLSIEIGRHESLARFYEIFVERMRDLGSPVHGFGFLKAVVESFGPRARVVLVKKGSTPVGGLIALAFKGDLVVPWATCLKEHFALCPNMLLYWETIKMACTEGFTRFDFGRSTRQSGTYRFKRQWGAQEEPLFWYRIPIASRRTAPISSDDHSGALATRLWRRLPVAVTRHLGPCMRRYLIQ